MATYRIFKRRDGSFGVHGKLSNKKVVLKQHTAHAKDKQELEAAVLAMAADFVNHRAVLRGKQGSASEQGVT